MATIDVTDLDFQEKVLKSELPVLVDYWAEWCGPCKQIAASIESISEDFAGKLIVAKLNIDENPQTPGKYGVRGIPTLTIFKDGNVVAVKIGAMPKTKIYEWVQSIIAG